MTTSSDEFVRSFIAADPGEAVRTELRRVQRALKKALNPERMKISWPAPDTMHLTLLFLGDIPAARTAEFLQTMDRAVRDFAAMDLSLGALDFFGPPDRPRVLWAGLDAPQALFDLQARLAEALRALGVETGEQPFHPHFTLGRIKRGRSDESFFHALEHTNVEPLRFAVTAVELLKSELATDGARHTLLGSLPLRPPQ